MRELPHLSILQTAISVNGSISIVVFLLSRIDPRNSVLAIAYKRLLVNAWEQAISLSEREISFP